MSRKVRDVMTKDLVCMPADTTIKKAAEVMRDNDIGDVVVTSEAGRVCGIATDRDLVVRAVSQGATPDEVTLGDVCSQHVIVMSPSDSVKDAVALMRDEALRRLVVVDGGRPVGIVSLGDLARERDPQSALADISSAEPNT